MVYEGDFTASIPSSSCSPRPELAPVHPIILSLLPMVPRSSSFRRPAGALAPVGSRRGCLYPRTLPDSPGSRLHCSCRPCTRHYPRCQLSRTHRTTEPLDIMKPERKRKSAAYPQTQALWSVNEGNLFGTGIVLLYREWSLRSLFLCSDD